MTNMMMTNITMITMVNQVPLPSALDTALAVPANCALGTTTIIIIITIIIITITIIITIIFIIIIIVMIMIMIMIMIMMTRMVLGGK